MAIYSISCMPKSIQYLLYAHQLPTLPLSRLTSLHFSHSKFPQFRCQLGGRQAPEIVTSDAHLVRLG